MQLPFLSPTHRERNNSSNQEFSPYFSFPVCICFTVLCLRRGAEPVLGTEIFRPGARAGRVLCLRQGLPHVLGTRDAPKRLKSTSITRSPPRIEPKPVPKARSGAGLRHRKLPAGGESTYQIFNNKEKPEEPPSPSRGVLFAFGANFEKTLLLF